MTETAIVHISPHVIALFQVHAHKFSLKIVSDCEVKIPLKCATTKRKVNDHALHKQNTCLILGVGSQRDESRELLPLLDGKAVINVEHSLFPVGVTRRRSYTDAAKKRVSLRRGKHPLISTPHLREAPTSSHPQPPFLTC